MPPKDKGGYAVYITDEYGNATELKEIGTLGFPELGGTVGIEEWRPPERVEITISVKIPKYARCKSRKRMVKLLMGLGIERDAANWMAWKANAEGLPYRKAWKLVMWALMEGKK